MRIIALLPVKNEAWILRNALCNISIWADHIIVADQYSTDGSREIYMEFPKVHCVDNPYEGHSNKVRWLLLDTARQLFDGNNLMVSVDADEVIPPHLFTKELSTYALTPGTVISMPWIQLWRSTAHYRTDGVWKDNRKAIAFVDDSTVDYDRTPVINDHTSRVPTIGITHELSFVTPLLHLQFVAWDRFQWKQAWYRCSELINNVSPRRINSKYAPTLTYPTTEELAETPPEWLSNSSIPDRLAETPAEPWHREKILLWFGEFGPKFFEPLQIWHIPELHNLFKKKHGREPKPKTFPSWLVSLNVIRRKILTFCSNHAHFH